MDDTKVNIEPTTGYLSILPAINYRAWFALAEFVDNSIQSYLNNKSKLKATNPNYKLKIAIYVDNSEIKILDNAAGISEKDFPRAFRAAARPENTKGLSEFGMGMKTAACWFSPLWTVNTKPLGEKEVKIVTFNIAKIVKDDIKELDVKKTKAPSGQHYTQVVLQKLRKAPKGQTIKKMKELLSSMYRTFIEKNEIEIRYNNEKLGYKTPDILHAPYFLDVDQKKTNLKKIKWLKKLSFVYGAKKRKAYGYAAIRDPASTKLAGFALFRRSRLIQGVGEDEGYRPLQIFKAPNSFIYQRVIGEIHLDEEEVAHTKDGFQWGLDEEIDFVKKLKEELETKSMPILSQADRFRKDRQSRDLKVQTEVGLDSSVQKLSDSLKVLEAIKVPIKINPAQAIEKPKAESEKRRKTLHFESHKWIVEVVISYDKSETEWLRVQEVGKKNKEIKIQIAMGMGFSAQYFGDQPDEIEGMINIASSIALAEIVSRERGNSNAHAIRTYLNEILRSQPPLIK
jgi:hypothetical protein